MLCDRNSVGLGAVAGVAAGLADQPRRNLGAHAANHFGVQGCGV